MQHILPLLLAVINTCVLVTQLDHFPAHENKTFLQLSCGGTPNLIMYVYTQIFPAKISAVLLLLYV
jgi:hypothetical protein